MNSFQRNIFRTIVEENPIGLEMGSISSTSQILPTDACNLIIDSVCYISTSINGVITSGDIVYQDVSGTNPILGGDTYYKIYLVDSYIAQVDNLGVITINSTCP